MRKEASLGSARLPSYAGYGRDKNASGGTPDTAYYFRQERVPAGARMMGSMEDFGTVMLKSILIRRMEKSTRWVGYRVSNNSAQDNEPQSILSAKLSYDYKLIK
jgi:hypothetical protein